MGELILDFIDEEAEILRDAVAGQAHRAVSPQQAFQPALEVQ